MVQVTSNGDMVSVELKGNGEVVISETIGAIAFLLANLHAQMEASADGGVGSYIAEQYAKEDIKHILMQGYMTYTSEVNRQKQEKKEKEFESGAKYRDSDEQYFS